MSHLCKCLNFKCLLLICENKLCVFGQWVVRMGYGEINTINVDYSDIDSLYIGGSKK